MSDKPDPLKSWLAEKNGKPTTEGDNSYIIYIIGGVFLFIVIVVIIMVMYGGGSQPVPQPQAQPHQAVAPPQATVVQATPQVPTVPQISILKSMKDSVNNVKPASFT